MPKEMDKALLDAIARALHAPTGFVEFRSVAFDGSPDEPYNVGLNAILGKKRLSATERKRLLREALARHIIDGREVNRVERTGDREMQARSRFGA